MMKQPGQKQKNNVRPFKRRQEQAPPDNGKSAKTQETNGSDKPCEAKGQEEGGNGNGGPKEASAGKQEKPNSGKMSAAQQIALQSLSKRRGMTQEEVDKMAADKYGMKVENLSAIDAAAFIRQLQQSA